MESPGTCIKRERELRGFSIKDVHEATRIPEKNLLALEADDFEALPQQAFVKGYIRACCKYMGLDETDLVLRYELFIKDDTSEEEPPPPEEEKSPVIKAVSLSSKQIVTALVVIGLVIIVLFYLLRGPSRQGEPAKGFAPATEPVPAAEIESTTGVEAEAAPEIPEEAAVIDAAPPAEEAAVPGHVLKVIATDTVWMKFTIDDKEPFEVLFKEGEARQWLLQERVSLVIGNAAGATLVFDGQPVKIDNEPGRVIRLNLPLPE
ncbi:MAG: helix-turn-helix domain-containing protein [Thermodesulfobacteriota bacterium]